MEWLTRISLFNITLSWLQQYLSTTVRGFVSWHGERYNMVSSGSPREALRGLWKALQRVGLRSTWYNRWVQFICKRKQTHESRRSSIAELFITASIRDCCNSQPRSLKQHLYPYRNALFASRTVCSITDKPMNHTTGNTCFLPCFTIYLPHLFQSALNFPRIKMGGNRRILGSVLEHRSHSRT